MNRRRPQEAPTTFSQKWGDDPFTALGHVQVPTALIDYAARLGLSSEECWLLVCVLKFKHDDRDPFPSQDTLAKLFGQSERNIRRILQRLKDKGLMTADKIRLDTGHYSHIVYDFTQLRVALNECYYQDHPQKRPKSTIGHNMPLVVSQRHERSKTPDSSCQTTGQTAGRKSPLNKSPELDLEKEKKKERVLASPFSGEEFDQMTATEREPWMLKAEGHPDVQEARGTKSLECWAMIRGIVLKPIARRMYCEANQ